MQFIFNKIDPQMGFPGGNKWSRLFEIIFIYL